MTGIFSGSPLAGLDASSEFKALIAGTKGGKIVRGEDIAKTSARRATDAERWRYGVELRITGSRWRPQTRAPHYPAPEPYVYRKRTQSLAWQPYRLGNLTIEGEYDNWLAARDKAAAAQPTEECSCLTSTGPVPVVSIGIKGSVDASRLLGRTGPMTTNNRLSTSRNQTTPKPAPINGVESTTIRCHSMTENPTADVVRLHVAASTSTPAREDDLAERKEAAAALLREIADGYGPRRAHKLRAMADWLLAVPAAQIKREG